MQGFLHSRSALPLPTQLCQLLFYFFILRGWKNPIACVQRPRSKYRCDEATLRSGPNGRAGITCSHHMSFLEWVLPHGTYLLTWWEESPRCRCRCRQLVSLRAVRNVVLINLHFIYLERDHGRTIKLSSSPLNDLGGVTINYLVFTTMCSLLEMIIQQLIPYGATRSTCCLNA